VEGAGDRQEEKRVRRGEERRVRAWLSLRAVNYALKIYSIARTVLPLALSLSLSLSLSSLSLSLSVCFSVRRSLTRARFLNNICL